MAVLQLFLLSGVPLMALLLWYLALFGEERGVLHDTRTLFLTTSTQGRLPGQQQVTNSLSQSEGEDLLLFRQPRIIADDDKMERKPSPRKSSESEQDDHKNTLKDGHNDGSQLNVAQDLTARKEKIRKRKSIQEELPSPRLGPESRLSMVMPLMTANTSRWGAVADHHYRYRREDRDRIPGSSNTHENDLLYLCDHPPRKFSPSFMGQKERCLVGQKATAFYFDVKDFCIQIYHENWNREVMYYTFDLTDSDRYEIFMDENIVSICLPLHVRFSDCYVHKFLTICQETKTIFVDTKSCPLRDNWDSYFIVMLVWNVYYEDWNCLEKICDGTYEVIQREVNGIEVQLQNTHIRHDGEACWHSFDPLELFGTNRTVYVSANTHWISCYSLYTVAWTEDPGEYGNWSYLPMSCLVYEVVIVVMVACVAFSGVMGNSMVLLVMVSSAQQPHQSKMLRTSLAFADLLIGVFVIVPSFYYHLEAFYVPPDITVWESDYLQLNITEFSVLDKGFPLFQAVLFNVCSVVSIMTVFILSVERFVLTWRGLKYGQYFTMPTVKVIIAMTWIAAFLETVYSTTDNKKSFTASWDSPFKLPLGVSMYEAHVVGDMMFTLNLTLLSVMCISTGTFSIWAIVNFLREQARLRAEWRALKMKVVGPIRQENIHIITSQLLITSFFFLSVIPKGILSILNQMTSSYYLVFAYIATWFFLASTAWNPWIYNIRSAEFRKDLALLFKGLRTKLSKALGYASVPPVP